MIGVKEAKQIILECYLQRKNLTIPLCEASGLVVSEDILAGVDIPNFVQSSMDGYALRFVDKDGPLEIIGEMAAGTPEHLEIKNNQAARIFTGAPLPKGADTVVMQEKIHLIEGLLIVDDMYLKRWDNVRQIGAEVQKGELAMIAGTYLSAAAVGFLAGIGCAEVAVLAPPRVCIILTGNELQEPGHPLEFGQVYEANSFQLKAALHKIGIKEILVLAAGDEPSELAKVLLGALRDNDIILLNGGVSVGDYDCVTQAARSCGVVERFHGVSQKPGKPLFFGTKQDKLIFGLPGNPSSSLTCFYEYVLPVLENCMGLKSGLAEITATATHNHQKQPGLVHFVKAFYSSGKVTPLHAQESFRLHSFAQANCLIVLQEGSDGCAAGEDVAVHLLPI